MHDADIIIVGAGLTGLRAGLECARAGASVMLIDQERAVGGRTQTLTSDGCLLDVGFQVLHTAYPELKTLPSLSKLKLRPFLSGASVYFSDDTKPLSLLNPVRHPTKGIKSLLSRACTLTDLIKCSPIVASTYRRGPRQANTTVAALLKRGRFSSLFEKAFLQPMFRGVLLDERLTSDAGLALFYAYIIAAGRATLPEKGIQALPQLLADEIGSGHILLNTAVKKIRPNRVELEDGRELSARCIVCTTDALSAAALGGRMQTLPFNGTRTVYYRSPSPPFEEPILTLSGDGLGPVNHLAVLTNVQPSYTADSSALISLSIIGRPALAPLDELLVQIRDQMRAWFGNNAQQWEFVKDFYIPAAVPARPLFGEGWEAHGGIYYAGDYLSYGSQNGALQAGRRVAEEVLRNFF